MPQNNEHHLLLFTNQQKNTLCIFYHFLSELFFLQQNSTFASKTRSKFSFSVTTPNIFFKTKQNKCGLLSEKLFSTVSSLTYERQPIKIKTTTMMLTMTMISQQRTLENSLNTLMN